MATRAILAGLLALALAVSLGCTRPAEPPGSAASPPASPSPDQYTALRMRMVDQQIRERDVSDEAVLRAMEKVPRHLFVPAEVISEAYEDRPVPIGHGQTISQPYIVALMTEHLSVRPGDRVLEIGTGSGYQAAVLAELTDEVYSVEIVHPLAESSLARLRELGYDKVRTRMGDGYFGWEEHAPYDAIVVTAAPDHIPQPLVRQLRDGGRMVIPVGPPGSFQTLWKLEKHGDRVVNTNLGGVVFVPLTGER